MPVVRELINRISFKPVPGDVENVQAKFLNIKTVGLGAITAITGAGNKLFADFQKDVQTVKFFSKTNEEAEALLDTVEKIRGAETVSKRERAQAAAEFAKLSNINAKDIEGIIGLLERVAVAQPELDFPETIQTFVEFVKTGDISSLENLGAIGKELGEQLRLGNFSAEQTIKGQENRFQFVGNLLQKNRERINELAADFETTLPFALEKSSKAISDIFSNLGQLTGPEMTDFVNSVTNVIRELNESKEFWEVVRGTLGLMKDILDAGALGIRTIGNVFSGDFEAIGEDFSKTSQLRQPGAQKQKGFGEVFGEIRDFVGGKFGSEKQEVEVKGELVIRGEDVGNLDMQQIQGTVNQMIEEKVVQPMRNIIARKGGTIPTPSAPRPGGGL